MAELVDAADSKSVVCKDMGVRVSLGAPFQIVERNRYKGNFNLFFVIRFLLTFFKLQRTNIYVSF